MSDQFENPAEVSESIPSATSFQDLDPFAEALPATPLAVSQAIPSAVSMQPPKEGDFFIADASFIAVLRAALSVIKPLSSDEPDRYGIINISKLTGKVRVSTSTSTVYFEFVPHQGSRLTQDHEIIIEFDRLFKILNSIYTLAHYIVIHEHAIEIQYVDGQLLLDRRSSIMGLDFFEEPKADDYTLLCENIPISIFVASLTFVGRYALSHPNCNEVAVKKGEVLATDGTFCFKYVLPQKFDISMNPQDTAAIAKFFNGVKIGDISAPNTGAFCFLYVRKTSLEYLLTFQKFDSSGKKSLPAFLQLNRKFIAPSTDWIPSTEASYKDVPPFVVADIDNSALQQALNLLSIVADTGFQVSMQFSSGNLRVTLLSNLGHQSHKDIPVKIKSTTSVLQQKFPQGVQIHFGKLIQMLKSITSSWIEISIYDNMVSPVLLLASENQAIFSPSVSEYYSNRTTGRDLAKAEAATAEAVAQMQA